MVKSAVVDPDRLDREAHDLFLHLTPAPTTGQDKDGRPVTITPGERYAEIARRARFITVSDVLAQAVAALLARHGVTAEVEHVRVDPAADGDEQVLGLLVPVEGGRAVVPVRPASTRLRGYPVVDGIDLAGHQPLFAVDLPAGAAGADGWVGADAIGSALLPHLAVG
ncbi:hypothetical protein ACIGNX_02520 [Actinosynnema sp. NPDC053489]|uniref:hypothetical protein n=1 Tax=Actinosynnema sp. NPDC053489 TaxID=3363916 RepID=UPI0037CC366C